MVDHKGEGLRPTPRVEAPSTVPGVGDSIDMSLGWGKPWIGQNTRVKTLPVGG